MKNKTFELLTRIKDVDLFSKEAMYHASYRKSFSRNLSAWWSSNPLTINNQDKVEEAHRAAFSSVKEVIDRDIVLGEKIVQLSYFTKIYTKSLSKKHFGNKNYRQKNLKAKITANIKLVYHLQSLDNLNQVSSTITKYLLKN